jgi:uncharacterized protein (DUF433 family)
MAEIFPGISVDADVRFGKPCIKGTRKVAVKWAQRSDNA